jgi:survival of motor neuron protein-interacting protein 1
MSEVGDSIDGDIPSASSSSSAAAAAAADVDRSRPSKRRRKDGAKGGPTSALSSSIQPLTLDDVANMDASTYISYVNYQARSLPDVFVASPVVVDHDHHHHRADDDDDAAKDTTTTSTSTNNDDVVLHELGSLSTMRVFLSDKFGIFPPPSMRHLPPSSPTPTPSSTSTSTSDGWVGGTISNFSNLRSYLESEHSRICEGRRRSTALGEGRIYAVPRMRDRPGWHAYCLGREQAYGNACGYDDDDDDDDEVEVEGVTEAEEAGQKDGADGRGNGRVVVGGPSFASSLPPASSSAICTNDGRPPTTLLLLQLDQVLIRAVFHHHMHYLVEWRMDLTRDRAMWLYALLARMEKPLHREECVGVRMLLRECCRRRWELKLPPMTTTTVTTTTMGEEAGKRDNDDLMMRGGAWEQLALLNTLIAIAGVYFEQGARSGYGAGGGDGMDSLFSCSRN